MAGTRVQVGELCVSRTAVRPPEISNSLLGKASELSPSRMSGMPNIFFCVALLNRRIFYIYMQ